ncbi:ROK family transcriptional regulator [Pleomorphomonas carboxyditropha]|uniref:Sugar kinase n=1 Tax=Pleomorphomonas carboxyditropha TaxID=2023338 RepID=A0A2G9WU96_9HYPH|nr:ROK family transcriptional regulator [Pleomorphomonas carboxyditropha]PIO98287.1 sugar kinase [Pleomorphomonas carboxyditropha]
MNEQRPIRAKSGANQEGTSAHNRRVIIDALRVNGALSRADLARATGLTKQAVSNLIETLESEGLVASEDLVRKGRGQPSTPYRLVANGAYAIGLQIDRHVSRVIVVDLVGNILARATARVPPRSPEEGAEVVLDLLAGVRTEFSARRPDAEARIAGIGVAMPGPFGVEIADDSLWLMQAWQSFPLLDRLAAGTGLAVSLQNDAAACATAERMVGAAHGLDHVVCIYVGYGIGAGLILGGELYGGANGNAGEIGMVLLGGPDDPTPLEHRASIASLYAMVDIDPADPGQFAKLETLVQTGDRRVAAWIDRAAHDLRLAVHTAETLFDPQTVILSSSVPGSLMPRLMAAIEPLRPSLSPTAGRAIPRLRLGMTDPWAVAIGAAADPIRRAFDPSFSAILKRQGE